MCVQCESAETVEVCEGCYYYAANGADSYFDGEQGELDLERIELAHSELGIVALVDTYPADDSEHERYPIYGFSRSACSVCRSPFGGDRYSVVMVTR